MYFEFEFEFVSNYVLKYGVQTSTVPYEISKSSGLKETESFLFNFTIAENYGMEPIANQWNDLATVNSIGRENFIHFRTA